MLTRPAAPLATDYAAVGIHSSNSHRPSPKRMKFPGSASWLSSHYLVFFSQKFVEKSIAKSCQRS